jgi:hypothetical protein
LDLLPSLGKKGRTEALVELASDLDVVILLKYRRWTKFKRNEYFFVLDF